MDTMHTILRHARCEAESQQYIPEKHLPATTEPDGLLRYPQSHAACVPTLQPLIDIEYELEERHCELAWRALAFSMPFDSEMEWY